MAHQVSHMDPDDADEFSKEFLPPSPKGTEDCTSATEAIDNAERDDLLANTLHFTNWPPPNSLFRNKSNSSSFRNSSNPFSPLEKNDKMETDGEEDEVEEGEDSDDDEWEEEQE